MVTSTARLLFGVLERAEQFEAALGDGWTKVRDALLLLLDRLERDGERTVRRDVDAFIDQLLESSAGNVLRPLLQGQAPAVRAATRDVHSAAPGAPQPEPPMGFVRIPVYYGTDRAADPVAAPDKRYSGDRGAPEFGVAVVSVPVHKALGDLPAPRWWKLEFTPDPAKHVVLQEIESLEEAAFTARLADDLAAADDHDVLLYVHGYNVAFADAARRAAQIAKDLSFGGRTLLFSWPSRGSALSYAADEASIEWSTPHFEAFLRLVMTRVGARRVHLLSHSMGNRAVTRAVNQVDPAHLPPGSASLSQVVFAAPDVDRDVFLQLAKIFPGRAERFTLYASRRDLALAASKLLHRMPRAGDGGDDVLVAAGFDTIEASAADTSLLGLGHSYYGDLRSILSDIGELLRHGAAPAQRMALAQVNMPHGVYWSMLP